MPDSDYLKSGMTKLVSMILKKSTPRWIMRIIISGLLFCFPKNILVTRKSRAYMMSGLKVRWRNEDNRLEKVL